MTSQQIAQNQHFRRLFSPAKISNVRLKNRLVMLPMGTAYADSNGEVTTKTIDYFVERARGGVGLIELGNISVDSRINVNGLVLDSDWFLSGHYELVEAVHAYGTKIAAQLNHPGRQKNLNTLQEGERLISASPVPVRFLGQDMPTPRPLEEAEVYQMMDKFAAAALRAKKVGYDMVEIHCGHGYLINQFMSPYINKRSDKFGGSVENRMRFPLELIKRVREQVGNEYPVGVRMCGDEFLEGGISVKESPAIAKMFTDAGVAYISVSSPGGYDAPPEVAFDSMWQKEGWKIYLAEAVKKAVNIPIIGCGILRTPAFCEELLAQGKVDFIGLGRTLIADPQWPNKAREGRLEEICPCLSCNECATPSPVGRLGNRRCTVNAAAGREGSFVDIKPAEVKKEVMVVGGGPAGMETARVAALRGHQVTLYEKASQLGGALTLAATPPGKDVILKYRDYLINQVRKLKVKVELNTEVSPELVDKVKPDVVVVASGAIPLIPRIQGIDNKNVVTAWDVLSGKAKIGERKSAVIIGGSGVGCETADFLAAKGNKVTIVEMRSDGLAVDMQPTNRIVLINRLEVLNIPVLLNREAVGFTDKGVLTRHRQSGDMDLIKADYIILAMGSKPVRELADSLAEKNLEVYSIGDCEKPRIIKEAIYEASMVGRKI